LTRHSPHDRAHHAALVRGVAVNVAGLVAKLGGPALLLIVTRLFGPAITGVFLLTQLLAELARSVIVSGYNDAVTIFGSREAGSAAGAGHDEAGVYRVIAGVLRAVLASSVLLALLAYVFADPIAQLFPAQADLAIAIRYAALALPFLAFGQAATAATKIRVRMEYDVGVWGFGKPTAMLLAAIWVHHTGGSLPELMAAYLIVHVALAVIAAWSFARSFDLRSTVRAWRARERVPGMHRFAIPQNLNLTFSRYQSRVDVIVLGMLGYQSAMIAFYVTGSLIAACLLEIRMVFTAALAPVVARYHGVHDRSALEHLLARVSRWTTTLIVPVTALAVIWRKHILAIIDPSYTHDSRFLALLLVSMLINSSLGLAGNYLVFMGHSGWNLCNSLFVAALNTTLSFVLIPHFGLLGAAFAACIAALVVSVAQVIEVRYIEGIRLLLSEVYKPYVGLGVLGALALAFWDPADLGGAWTLLGASLACIWAYLVVLLALRHEELMRDLRGSRAVLGVSIACAGVYMLALLLRN
jgi:O-antigen/teichoic acid export membrane protein